MDIKRTVLKIKLHLGKANLHPLQICAIVQKKFPELGEVQRGWASDGTQTFEHFWFETPEGTIVDPVNIGQAWSSDLTYNVEKTDDALVHKDNDTLWETRETLFTNWPKEGKSKLKKILGAP